MCWMSGYFRYAASIHAYAVGVHCGLVRLQCFTAYVPFQILPVIIIGPSKPVQMGVHGQLTTLHLLRSPRPGSME